MTILPKYFETVQDGLGNAVEGAAIRVEVQADSSLASLFSDVGGTTLIGNPVYTDNEGQAEFFVAPGVYKITITANGGIRIKQYVTLGGGTGNVTGPEVSVVGNIPLFAGVTGQLLSDSGKSISTDPTLGGVSPSANKIPVESAVKAYIDALADAINAVQYKGGLDCSTNPNYPAASAGHLYVVQVAGKIGGGSGPNVEAGDMLFCKTDSTASGNHATVGAQWNIVQLNIDAPLKSADIGVLLQAYDAATAKYNVAQQWSKPQRTSAGALTHNTAFDASDKQRWTANVNGSSFTIANPTGGTPIDGQTYVFQVTYTTSHSIAWGSKFKGVSGVIPTATAGATDEFAFRYDSGADVFRSLGYRLNNGA